ncbi:hypothetical protein TUM4261_32740 [Shewanella sp. c952]|uniref:hypothetical protein n=1 Tax=Shewanella sp. c952 TaxID=2815913 RepID=UPI001BBBD986|nr:hypothetical protein [Shewanella sp. c952]GIU15576.1 hypothetical protein TUM4261_32740 [Shewanella sp. c952]
MAIMDVKKNRIMWPNLNQITNDYDSPEAAYLQWRDELNLPNTDLPGMIQGDDGVTEIDLGFPVALDGDCTFISQSTEGSIGFFLETPTGSMTKVTRALSAAVEGQATVSRDFGSRGVSPSVVISCKAPSIDAKAFECKWQKNDNTAILRVSWTNYNSSSNKTELALKISQGQIEAVARATNTAAAKFQLFLCDSQANSASTLDAEGAMGLSLEQGTTYKFTSSALRYIRGKIVGADGQPASTAVRAYLRDTGRMVGSAISDAITGVYEIIVTDEAHYVVCLDDSVSQLNALVFDRVFGVD